MPPSDRGGARWFAWRYSPVLRVGGLAGSYVSAVLVVWLVVANRIPWTANFALLRNLAAGGLAGIFLLIPVGRFLREPLRLFASGVTAWALLSLTYMFMQLFFQRLGNRMGTFQLFMLGAVAFGVIAVISWVTLLLLAARHHHQAAIAARRRSV